MPEKNKAEKIDFRGGMERLEEIVDELESGEVDLEDALKIFEEGIKISKQLSGRLEKAEKQIRKLVEKSDGSVETELFEEIEDHDETL